MVNRVGDIIFDRRQIIGWGPTGTVVLRGTWGQEPVAVKRFLASSLRLDPNDFKFYKEQRHANILQLRDVISIKGFTYFALELCACNLSDYVAGKYSGPAVSRRTILLQIGQGLAHLHSAGVIHRALKPTNILISRPSDDHFHEVTVKLSEFGTSSTWNDVWPGCDPDSSEGWLSPEQLKSGPTAINLTTAVDVFTLGCLFYYVLTGGQHPFGSLPYFRDQRIMAGQHDLSALTEHRLVTAATELVESMIQRSPDQRLLLERVMDRSDFWSSDI